ncbi:MAG: dual specificity protein phosphatase family protein [bacterium]|nr:dual specificity protein phosphatase family protein [bacterium]
MEPKKHSPVPTEFSTITDFLSVGTNMCCGAHGEKLAELGATADLDLEEERQELPPHVSAYLWLPVRDHAAPSREQLSLGAAFIDAVAKQGGRVYVHCRVGLGRSPTMAAAYFITQGMTTDGAIARVQQGRPEAHPEPVQVDALRAFEQSVW